MDLHHQRDGETEETRRPLPSIGTLDTYRPTVTGHSAALPNLHTTPKIHFRKKGNNKVQRPKSEKTISEGVQLKQNAPNITSPERPTSGPYGDLRHDELDTEYNAPPPPKPLKKARVRPQSDKRRPPDLLSSSTDGLPPWRPAGLAIGKPQPLAFDNGPRLCRRRADPPRIPAVDPIPPIKQNHDKVDHGNTRTTASSNTTIINKNRHQGCHETLDIRRSDFDIPRLVRTEKKETQGKGNRDGLHIKPSKVGPRIVRNKLVESDGASLLSSCQKLLKEAEERVANKKNKDREELRVKGRFIKSATKRNNHVETQIVAMDTQGDNGDEGEGNMESQQDTSAVSYGCPCWKDFVHAREKITPSNTSRLTRQTKMKGMCRSRYVHFSESAPTDDVQNVDDDRDNQSNQVPSDTDAQANNSNHTRESFSHLSLVAEKFHCSHTAEKENSYTNEPLATSKNDTLHVETDAKDESKEANCAGDDVPSEEETSGSTECPAEGMHFDSGGLHKNESVQDKLESFNMVTQDIECGEVVHGGSTRIYEIPIQLATTIGDEIVDCSERQEDLLILEGHREEETSNETRRKTLKCSVNSNVRSFTTGVSEATSPDVEENSSIVLGGDEAKSSQNVNHDLRQEANEVSIVRKKNPHADLALEKESCERASSETTREQTNDVMHNFDDTNNVNSQPTKNTSPNATGALSSPDDDDNDTEELITGLKETRPQELRSNRSKSLNTVETVSNPCNDGMDVADSDFLVRLGADCEAEAIEYCEYTNKNSDESTLQYGDRPNNQTSCVEHTDCGNECIHPSEQETSNEVTSGNFSHCICHRNNEGEFDFPIESSEGYEKMEVEKVVPSDANVEISTLVQNVQMNQRPLTPVKHKGVWCVYNKPLHRFNSATGISSTGQAENKLLPCWSTFDFTKHRPNSTPAKACKVHDFYQYYIKKLQTQEEDRLRQNSDNKNASTQLVTQNYQEPHTTSTSRDAEDDLSYVSKPPSFAEITVEEFRETEGRSSTAVVAQSAQQVSERGISPSKEHTTSTEQISFKGNTFPTEGEEVSALDQIASQMNTSETVETQEVAEQVAPNGSSTADVNVDVLNLEPPVRVPGATLSFPPETGYTQFDCAFQCINVINYYSNLMARYTYKSQNTIRAALEQMPSDDDEMHLHATTCKQASKCAQEVQKYLQDYEELFLRFYKVEEAQDEFCRYVSDTRNFDRWKMNNDGRPADSQCMMDKELDNSNDMNECTESPSSDKSNAISEVSWRRGTHE